MSAQDIENYNLSTQSPSEFSVSKAANLLKISASTLRRFEQEGKIKSYRLSNNYRIYKFQDLVKLKELLEKPKFTEELTLSYTFKTQPVRDPVHAFKYSFITLFSMFLAFLIVKNAENVNSSYFGLLTCAKEKQTKACMLSILGLNNKGDAQKLVSQLNPDVLGNRSRNPNFEFNLYIPVNFKEDAIAEKDLQADGLAKLFGGLNTNNQNGMFGTGNVTLGHLAFSGSRNISNLGAIDLTTEKTLEEQIDIAGDVEGTGLNSVVIKKLNGIPLGDNSDDNSGGNILMIDDGEWQSLDQSEITELGKIDSGTWEGNIIEPEYGGTGLDSFTTGNLIYASATDTLSNLPIGTNGQVLTVSSGLPSWQASSSSCEDCVVTDPAATQTITPTSSTAIGLAVEQASGGSVDIFKITNNGGGTSYFSVNSTGNINLSSDINFSAATPTITITDGSSLTINDGTNTLLTLQDNGSVGGLYNIGSITTVGSTDITTGSNQNLTLSPNGTGDLILDSDGDTSLILSGFNCSTYGNGGVLTTDASGIVSCTDDDGGAGSGAFTSSSGIIDKITITDRLRLRGDAADIQLEVENVTTNTIPTADAVSINLTGGTAGITTDGVDALFINAEFGNGTANVNSGIQIDIDPVSSPSGDESFYALNIAGITGTSASEAAINIESGWDKDLNFVSTAPNISIGNGGTLTINDGTNTLLTLADSGSSGSLSLGGATISSAELDLLDGRSETLVDSINVGTYATTGVTAGSGLTGGGTVSNLTLNIGAGSGITVNADDIAVDATTSGTTTTTSANSGIESTAAGIRLLGGCSNSQVLAWNSSGSVWECSTASLISGVGDITAVGSMESAAVFADSTADDDWLGLGALAGRIEFDDQSVDEVNILSAYVGIGTNAPNNPLEVLSTTATQVRVAYDTSNYFTQAVSSAGAVTFDVTGSSAGFTFSDAGIFNGTATFNSDVDLTLAGSENIALSNTSASADQVSLTSTIADTNSVDVLSITVTDNTSSSGTGRGLFIETGNGSATLDAAIAINHTDTGQAMTSGITITGDASTAVSTAINLADAEIATALALGSNDITVGGVTLESNELALLDARGGVLVDSINVGTYATTGVTAGSGLTDGGTVGTLTLNIGAGNGITVNTDDIAVDATTSGTTTTISANSGIESTSTGIRLLGGCTNGQVLAWNSGSSIWECTSTAVGDITAVGSMESGAVFADSTADDDWLGLGVLAGRIEFDDQSVDEVNVLSAYVGIGTNAPNNPLEILSTTATQLRVAYDTSNYFTQAVSSAGAVTFDATGGSAGFTFSDAGIFNGTATFNSDADLTLAGSENLTLTNTSASADQVALTATIADTNSVDILSITVTDNTSSSGTGRGLFIETGNGSATLDAAIAINHTDTGQAMTSGITITGDASTAITTAINLADAEIATALALGSNDVTVGGVTLESNELALLDARGGVLVDSINVGTYATIGVTAGSGLTGGGTNGVLTLNIGAGNGITVNTDDIAVDATTSGTTTTTSANSGIESTSTGIRLLGGCSNSQVLSWNSSSSVWECATAAGTLWNAIGDPDGNNTVNLSTFTTQFDFTGTTTTGWTYNADSVAQGIAYALSVDALTSGKGIDLVSTSTAFTGSLAAITLSGSNAANTGTLLDITNSGTENTNTSVYIKHYATGTNNLVFRADDVSGDTTPVVIDGAGAVGIGTTSPGNKMHVVSAATNAAGLLVTGGTSVGSASANSGQMLLGDQAGAQGRFSYDYVPGYLYIDNSYNDNAGNIYIRTKTAGTAVNAITVLGSGNVGIGTTSPGVLLNVKGVPNSTLLKLEVPYTAAGQYVGTSVFNSFDSVEESRISTIADDNYGAHFAFLSKENTGVGGTLSEKMRITSGGNVGISDTTPDSPLEILSTTNPQFRISYADGTADATFGVDTNGAVTFDATGSSAGFTFSDAGIFNGSATFNTDVDLVLAGSENLALTNTSASVDQIALTSTIADTNSVDILSITVTDNTSSSGTGRGLYIETGNGSATLDAAIAINHTDTGQAMTSGITITGDSSTAITTAINLADDEIGTALALGSNNVTVGGVTLESNELALLDARGGVLVDSINVGTYATTGVTAGSGLTGGGTNGVLTLNIGAGNGITVNTDDIAVDATTSGTTTTTSANSGIESTSSGIRLLGGCSNSQVLAWNSSSSVWECATSSGSSTLQQAYVAGNTIDITSGEGALDIDAQSANVDFEIGQGTDTGDFRIWDGTDNWLLIDEDADTMSLGAAAGSGLTLDAGTGTINIGNSANAKTINIGSSTGATALNFTSGTGAQTFVSSVIAGTTSSAAFVFNANSLTTGDGIYATSSSITQGDLFQLATTGNTLTSGNLLNVSSALTNTTFTGNLASIDWSPSESTQIYNTSADLLQINLGQYANVGNLLNITDNGSALFQVSETAITSAIPHSFTAAGDVSMAYDLNFTNQTASYINSNGSLYLRAGEIFENNNLNLQTYGAGNLVFEPQGTGYLYVNSTSTSVDGAISSSSPSITVAGGFISTADADTISLLVRNTNASATFQNVGTAGSQGDPGLFTIEGATSATAYNLITAYNSNTRSDAAAVFRVRADGNVYGEASFNASGADYAEYFEKEENIEISDMIGLNKTTGKVRKFRAGDQMMGVFSNQPGFVGNNISSMTEGERDSKYALVGLIGQIELKVTSENGNIKSGDAITYSTRYPGVGTKAVSSGPMIGRALQNYDSKDPTKISKILVFIRPSWYTPESLALQLDDFGNLVTQFENIDTVIGQNVQQAAAEITSGMNSSLDSRLKLIDGALAELASKVETLESSQSSQSQNQTLNLENSMESLKNNMGLINDLLGISEVTQASESSGTSQYTGLLDKINSAFSELKDFISSLGITQNDNGLVISGDTNILGELTLNGLTTTGNANFGLLQIDSLANTLNINGPACFNDATNTLNSELCKTQTLYLQKNLAGNINLFDGKVVIEPDGKLTVKGTIEAETVTADEFVLRGTSSNIGSGIILSGQTKITLLTPATKANSKVFITATTSTGGQTLIVGNKIPDTSFDIYIDNPIGSDIVFDWWIVNLD